MRFLIFSVALLAGAGHGFAGQRTVSFKSADGCALEAFYLAPSSGSYVFINAHGLGSDKNEWGPFQEALQKRGLGYLTPDLRGHGSSLNCAGKEVSYRTFTRADWNKVSGDIEAAAAWLRKKKTVSSKMVFCGASIGANLALKAAAEGVLKPAAVLLLSPGLDYAGVKTGENLAAARPARILIAASEDDGYAWQSASYLAAAAAAKGLPVHFKAGRDGHGVNMFREPELLSGIIDWVLDTGKAAAKKN